MSWNGSNGISRKHAPKRHNLGRNNLFFAISVCLILTVFASAIWFIRYIPRNDQQPAQVKTKKLIKTALLEEIPTDEYIAHSDEDAKISDNIISVKKTINPFTGEEMFLTNRHHEVRENAGRIGVINPNNRYQPKRKLFKHSSENYICGLMRATPGMPVVNGRLPKNFDEDFLASYNDEITIGEEDSEEDIMYKKAMVSFKNQVKSQIDAGASISEIIKNERSEINKLADYRKNLAKILSQMRREGATLEEREETRQAANAMLEQKGLKPINADLPRIGEE